MRIGASTHAGNDPLPRDWDPALINFDEPFIRTLGVFLGTPQSVAREWHKRITQRITERFDDWRSSRMPSTLYGKSLAIQNSVLAVAPAHALALARAHALA